MPGIYGFDHIVVRVEDFNVGMGDMGSLPGLELRETGENPCEDASLAPTRSRSLLSSSARLLGQWMDRSWTPRCDTGGNSKAKTQAVHSFIGPQGSG